MVGKSTRKVWVTSEPHEKFCKEYETWKTRGPVHGGNIKLGVRVSIRHIVRFLYMVMNIRIL